MLIDPTAFIHPAAMVCGLVTLGARASVWAGCVLRGDTESITVGAHSNVQDGAVIHSDPGFPAIIGSRVAIGHRAVVHGCTVEDDCLIGIGAIVLNGAIIGAGSVIGAGAVVPEGMAVPPRSVVLGVPARVVREVDDALRSRQAGTVASYLALQERHRAGEFPLFPAGADRQPPAPRWV